MIENKNTNSRLYKNLLLFLSKKGKSHDSGIKEYYCSAVGLEPWTKTSVLYYTVLYSTHEFRVVKLLVTLAEWVMCFVVN